MLLFMLGSGPFLLVRQRHVYYRAQAHPGTQRRQQALDAGLTGLFSVCSAGQQRHDAWAAGKSLEHGNQRGLIGWLSVTIVLGGVFLFGQGREYLHLLGENITRGRNLFGTTFFTLTGFHGLHVIAGADHDGRADRHLLPAIPMRHSGESSLELVSLYWHFVDGMWVLIYGVVYFWSAFLGG